MIITPACECRCVVSKLIALVLALAMIALCGAAFAAAQTTQTGTIKITNAPKGITYNIYKLLDATVDDDAIAYTYGEDGVLPGDLATYFTKVAGTVNNVDATSAAKATDPNQLSDGAIAAIEAWLNTNPTAAAAAQTSNGTAVSFTGLGYGYYVITSTQGDSPKITVATLNAATVEIVDKNETEPDIAKKVKNAEGNWVEFRDANIGENVQYQIESTTANWYAPSEGSAQKQVKEYVIGDDLANSKLQIVSIDSIKVGSTDITESVSADGFPITIAWAVNKGTAEAPNWESKYNNGVKIEIIYTAKLTADAIIDTVNGNVNTADLDWNYVDGTPHFGDYEEHLKDEAKTETYGIAFVKVNENGEYLGGAVFQLPFYVNATPADDGSYVYAGTTASEGLTNSVTTPDSGAITIKGVKAGTYNITETQAPAGYNKLADDVSVTAVKISSSADVTETHRYWKIDDQGNVVDGTFEERNETKHFEYSNNDIAVTAITVLNTTGTVLPSTGGIGTTIFYVLGGLLIVGAAIILVSRRKAQD